MIFEDPRTGIVNDAGKNNLKGDPPYLKLKVLGNLKGDPFFNLKIKIKVKVNLKGDPIHLKLKIKGMLRTLRFLRLTPF